MNTDICTIEEQVRLLNDAETCMAYTGQLDNNFVEYCVQQDAKIDQVASRPLLRPNCTHVSRLQYGCARHLALEPMPASKTKRLKFADFRMPRFLFRVFGRGSGGDNRGILNNVSRITAHGFARGRSGYSSAFEIPEKELAAMVQGHLRLQENSNDEFSSWAATLEVALWFRRDKGEAQEFDHLAIIDTKLIKNDKFHVHQLWRAGYFDNYSHFIYPSEYLVHGVIEGPGYFCKPLKDLKLLKPLLTRCLTMDEKVSLTFAGMEAFKVAIREAICSVALEEHTVAASETARALTKDDPAYDDALIYLTGVFLGLRYKNADQWRLEDLDSIYRTLALTMSRPLQMQPAFWSELWLQHGVVYCHNFPEITRAIDFLKYMSTKRVIDGHMLPGNAPIDTQRFNL